MAKQRLDWLDIAKGIAILLVIVGHTVNNPSIIRQVIFSFHMPLFFILAGYTFRIKPWGELLKTSATRLLVPYFLVALSWWIPYSLANSELVDGSSLAAGLGIILFASGTYVPSYGAVRLAAPAKCAHDTVRVCSASRYRPGDCLSRHCIRRHLLFEAFRRISPFEWGCQSLHPVSHVVWAYGSQISAFA